MRVLISGAGIAGPTLAYWLHRYAFEPTLVERAPKLRSGGYIIDFWGVGFDIAEPMNLLPDIRRAGYLMREVRVVGDDGNRVAAFPVDSLARLANGRYISIPRGELASLIYRKIEGNVETIFNDSIASIDQKPNCVQVRFSSGGTRDFDVVIGADGLHSGVREIVFGPERQFERYLGYKVAVFEVPGYRPRDELVYVMHTEIGQQIGRFALREDRTLFFLIIADPEQETPHDIRAQKELLHRRFGNSGWESSEILDALDAASDLYFDRVSQVRMGGSGNSGAENGLCCWGTQHSAFRYSPDKVQGWQWLRPMFLQENCTAQLGITKPRFPDTRAGSRALFYRNKGPRLNSLERSRRNRKHQCLLAMQ
jgi:2-polyprenyl-6-methoxyphenol hydroxylase-like FAD-dependent oxidoreductase